MTRLLTHGALAVVLGAIAAGCGGSGVPVEKANKMLEEHDAKITADPAAGGPGSKQAQTAAEAKSAAPPP